MTKYIGHSGPKTLITIFAYGGVFDRTLMALLRETGYAARLNAGVAIRDEMLTITKDVDKWLCDLAIRIGDADEIRKIREQCKLIRSLSKDEDYFQLTITSPPQDALIDRARSITAQHFLNQTDADVMLMLDHDIDFCGPTVNFEGDICHLSRLASEENAIVSAMVSKKARGQGFASLLKKEAEITVGEPGLYECHYVGAAMCAYPRKVVQACYDASEDVAPGFRPIFLPLVVPHPHPQNSKWKKLHLSEDWALCHRASELGYKSYVSSRPLVAHWGNHAYTIVGDACPEVTANSEISNVLAANVSIDKAYEKCFEFSLLHATRGRPEEAKKTHAIWMERCTDTSNVEYIFSLDSDDELSSALMDYAREKNIKVIVGHSRGNVDAYNRAAYSSSGKCLIQVHDDLIPPQKWNMQILGKIVEQQKANLPFVLHVDDGLPQNINNKPNLLSILIGSREWFKKCGYFWCPDFISVYCDDHMTEVASKEDVIINAMDIKFEHKWQGAGRDETQKRSYQQKNWDHGKRMLELHRAAGFPMNPELWQGI